MIGTGEQSQFGEVFKMMQAEEVRAAGRRGEGNGPRVATVCIRVFLSQSRPCSSTESQRPLEIGACFLFLMLKLSMCAGVIVQWKGHGLPSLMA